MVSIAGIVIAVALFYLLLVDPAWTGVTNLQRDLPVLRSDAAQVAGIADATGRSPKRNASIDLQTAIQTALTAGGLTATSLSANASGSVTVKFDKIVHSTAATWAQRTVRDVGVRIESATLVASAEPGRVNAEYTFTR
jgi:general secretion pathway protein M